MPELGAIALAGVLVGASYVAVVGQSEAESSGGGGVKNGVLQAPTQPSAVVLTQSTSFVQKSIDQKPGVSAIYITNKDPEFHTFDVDVDGQHYSYPLAGSSTTAVVLNLKLPGRYTFWCAVSDHRKSGMEGSRNVSAN